MSYLAAVGELLFVTSTSIWNFLILQKKSIKKTMLLIEGKKQETVGFFEGNNTYLSLDYYISSTRTTSFKISNWIFSVSIKYFQEK